jgi:hypothetical protein
LRGGHFETDSGQIMHHPTVQVFSCIEDGWCEYTDKLLAVRVVRVQPSINHNAGGGCNN